MYICSFFISKSHGWAPKLSYRFFNMGLNNSYIFYKIIHQKYTPQKRMMTMPEAMQEATHTLLQRGPSMRTRDAVHPPPVRDLTNAFDTHARAFRTDAKGGVSKSSQVRVGEGATLPADRKRALQMMKQRNPWCIHQLTPCIPKKNEKQYCAYERCPGLRKDNKRNRPCTSTLKCEECSVKNNKETYFCMTIENENGTKKFVTVTTSTTESTSHIQIIKYRP